MKHNALIAVTLLATSVCYAYYNTAGRAGHYATIREVEKRDIERIKDHLTQFSKTTSSKIVHKKVSHLAGIQYDNDILLIAKIDAFGLARYFIFETDNDVDELVNWVKCNHAHSLSLYYLKDVHLYNILKVSPVNKAINQESENDLSSSEE